jgi:SAM-dependent methyltransferase
MPKINYFLDSWRYFTFFNKGKLHGTVLDYGSNYGRFLESSNNMFPQENYTGVDVDIEALESGKNQFPNARFIHYDKYNVMYNRSGQKNIWPDLNDQFDNIISYSVLTHTTIDDTLDTIKWLYDRLKPGKKMFLTWLENKNKRAIDFFRSKRIKTFGECDEIQTEDYVYLVDNKATKVSREATFFLTFYQRSYLTSLLKDYNHELISSPIIFKDCFQDCLIITKE